MIAADSDEMFSLLKERLSHETHGRTLVSYCRTEGALLSVLRSSPPACRLLIAGSLSSIFE
jgi:hypothetical protein